MRVKIGPYINWFGPYQLAERICFWAKEEKDEYGIPRKPKPEWVHKFGEWLAHGSILPDPTPDNPMQRWKNERPDTPLSKFLQWIHSKKKRKIQVKIDPWDTWGMDHTLAYIILPMLEQVQNKKQGAPFVDDEDVPECLRSTSAPPVEDYETDDNHFHRWIWVLGEMIFAFRSKLDDSWQNQFYSGESDWISEASEFDENNKPTMFELKKGSRDTFKVNHEGLKAYQQRISNGFRLFGKYYESLYT